MTADTTTRGWTRPSLILAFASLAIHLFVNGGYGFFRDELYFIVCGLHPAWGYVDQPPLVPLIAAGSHALFGDFLLGFRLVPALAMTAMVALTAEFTRLIGGDRFAQGLAGLCALGAAVFLVHGLLLSTDMFQALTWLGCSWCIVRIAQTGDQRWWIAFGLITGFSLLTKYLIAFYLIALVPGLLMSPLRRALARPWIYAGAALALAMVLPNILWQQQQGWPFLELGAAGASHKNLALSPLGFFSQQLLLVGPLAAIVWLAGLCATAVRPAHAAYRAFAIAYVLLFAFFVISHGKAYYLAPIYPVLLGFGAVAIARRLAAAWMRRAALAAIAISSALVAPMAVPLLPFKTYIAYARAMGMSPSALAGEHLKLSALPQHFADMFGWREMAADVETVWRTLSPADQARAVVFGQNYGEAAAIDVFGHGLPPAISGHNNYYVWGPRGHDGSVMVVIGGDAAKMEGQFQSVTLAGRIETPYAMPYETNLPIYILRGAKTPLPILWPRLKHFE
jgi:4-amino-4-deoxy-L-arabinose transferase-like glycosyltransferase